MRTNAIRWNSLNSVEKDFNKNESNRTFWQICFRQGSLPFSIQCGRGLRRPRVLALTCLLSIRVFYLVNHYRIHGTMIFKGHRCVLHLQYFRKIFKKYIKLT